MRNSRCAQDDRGDFYFVPRKTGGLNLSPQPPQSVILSEVEIARSAFSTQSKDPYNLHVTAAIFKHLTLAMKETPLILRSD
jgi:hypothetical protein